MASRRGAPLRRPAPPGSRRPMDPPGGPPAPRIPMSGFHCWAVVRDGDTASSDAVLDRVQPPHRRASGIPPGRVPRRHHQPVLRHGVGGAEPLRVRGPRRLSPARGAEHERVRHPLLPGRRPPARTGRTASPCSAFEADAWSPSTIRSSPDRTGVQRRIHRGRGAVTGRTRTCVWDPGKDQTAFRRAAHGRAGTPEPRAGDART
jgi:hypothetical protein